MQIFLSYRRTDVGGHAGRLTDALTRRLGAKSVFQDVTAIAPGQEFTIGIDRALDACDAVLAVIGPGWLTASTPQGNRRLTEPCDYVRTELARPWNGRSVSSRCCVELTDVAEGERAQKRSERAGRPDPTEQPVHPAVPQQIGVGD